MSGAADIAEGALRNAAVVVRHSPTGRLYHDSGIMGDRRQQGWFPDHPVLRVPLQGKGGSLLNGNLAAIDRSSCLLG